MDQPSVFVLFVLVAVPAFYFLAEHKTGWRLWSYLPPLLWIYATPLLLRLLGVMPTDSPVYAGIRAYLLPLFITLLVMTIDLRTVVGNLGRGLPVLLISTLCVIVGAPLGYLAVSPWLPGEAWTGYGALAGSWIGGTANMAAMERALGTPPEQMGLAIIADQAVFLVWLPLLIVSARYAEPFNRWVKARPITVGSSGDKVADKESDGDYGEKDGKSEPTAPAMTHLEVPPMHGRLGLGRRTGEGAGFHRRRLRLDHRLGRVDAAGREGDAHRPEARRDRRHRQYRRSGLGAGGRGGARPKPGARRDPDGDALLRARQLRRDRRRSHGPDRRRPLARSPD
jgi:hypothetical protein